MPLTSDQIRTESRVLAYGASERGPLHVRESLPNQDAWLKASGGFGTLVAVGDGLGSRSASHFGSKAACSATKEAVVRWSKAPNAPVPLLIRLIELCWRLRIHPHAPSEAATTCLFALRRNCGGWIVGGIGDGLLAIGTGEEWRCYIGEHRENGFANETSCLGTTAFSKEWIFEELAPSPEPRFAVLATDGISDDLETEKAEGFCRWFRGKFGPMEPLDRWRAMRKALREWPTPRHTDDKTIAVLETCHETT